MDYLNIKVGENWVGSNKPIKVIIERSPNYIVIIDENFDIFYHLSKETFDCLPEKASDIFSKVSTLESQAENILKGKTLFNAKCLIASGLARMIADKNCDSADALLKNAEDKIQTLSKELLRITYLTWSFVTTCLALLLISLTWSFRTCLIGIWSNRVFLGVVCSLGGALGAFTSTFFRSKQYDANINVSRWIHAFDGALRIFYGLIAAIIIYTGIKAKLIFGFANDSSTSTNFIVFFLCCISGASEVILPNIIKQTEEGKIGKKNASKTGGGHE